MANHQRDPAKEAYWGEVIERQASSGLSMREFCRHEGVAERSLHAWGRTIGRPGMFRNFRRAFQIESTERDSNSAIPYGNTTYANRKREYCYEEGSFRGAISA